ncbi:hypothetical protein DLAC_07143 [Tieghemostelium lacteum]|uniref:Uncharacterized protein n=1 Tax=Tieghemostelium lacteum TaxID=361077 RepID=A0A151ZD85_TIELA|nr:hypothetical protein DLAC_07143 [Tieghemostelium lacteum]|eukprot:KYQ91907.1 hypothetical protein DLAC_07143 [Tieghemostelium lacteum]
MDNSIALTIQKLYNEFQDQIGAIDNLQIGNHKHLDFISEQLKQNQQQPSIDNIVTVEQPIDLNAHFDIKQSLKKLIDNCSQIGEIIKKSHFIIIKSKEYLSFSNSTDLNLLCSRGPSQIQLSIADLVDFMSTTLYYYDQDYQMKEEIINDLTTQYNSNQIQSDQWYSHCLLFKSSPLLNNQDDISDIESRVFLFNNMGK